MEATNSRAPTRWRLARYLILTTARHGEFYRAITLASRGPVEGAQIKAAAREYGIEFVGPLPHGSG
jgi:hypothetical protein